MIVYSDNDSERFMQGGCSMPEVLLTSCCAFLSMETNTTDQKITCVVGCTMVGATGGLMGGAFFSRPLEGMAIGAGLGLTIGITKVAINVISRCNKTNRH